MAEQGQSSAQPGTASRRFEHPNQRGRSLSWLQRQKLAEHGRSVLELHKQAQAPIQELDEETLMAWVDILLEDVESWEAAPIPVPVRQSDIDHTDWSRPQRCQQQRWNERLTETKEQLEWIRSYFDNDDYVAAGYFVAGKCVGLLVMGKVDPWIVNAVTHPGSSGCGGALLEYAVNKSEREGHGGRIELTVADDDSMHAYMRLGFVPDAVGSQMTLDPRNSDKWEKDEEDVWHLKKDIGKKYIS